MINNEAEEISSQYVLLDNKISCSPPLGANFSRGNSVFINDYETHNLFKKFVSPRYRAVNKTENFNKGTKHSCPYRSYILVGRDEH